MSLFLKAKSLSSMTLFGSIFMACLLLTMMPSFAHAATKTWGGGGVTNNWTDCANWVGGVCPNSGDDIVFNNTSVKDSTIDSAATSTIGNMSIASTYSGTITQQLSTLNVNSSFTQSGGTYSAAGKTVNMSGNNFSSYSFTCSGTFSGLLNLSITNGGGSNGTVTVSSGCTVTTVATINSTLGSLSIDGTVNFGPTVSVNNLTINNSGTVTASTSATFNVYGSFSQAASATFNSGGITVNMSGNNTSSYGFTCTGTFAGLLNLSITNGGGSNGTVTVSSGCTVTTKATINNSLGSLTVNGTVNVGPSVAVNNLTISNGATLTASSSAAFSVYGSFSQGSSATFNSTGMTITMSGSNFSSYSFTCTDTFGGLLTLAITNGGGSNGVVTVSSGCTVTMASNINNSLGSLTTSGTANFASSTSVALNNLTINDGGTLLSGTSTTFNLSVSFSQGTTATYNSIGNTINFAGTNFSSYGFTCSGTFNGLVNLSITNGGSSNGSVTVSSGCTVKTIDSLNNFYGSFIVNGALTFGTSSIVGALTVNSGGSVTLASSTLAINRADLTVAASGTFNGDTSKTVSFTSTTAQGIFCTGVFPPLVNIAMNGASDRAFTIGTGCIVTLAGNVSIPDPIVVNGSLDFNGFNVTATALTATASSTLRLLGNERFTSPAPNFCYTIELYGSSSYTMPTTTYQSLLISGSGTFATSSNLTVNCNFTQTGGTFNHTGTLTVASTSVTSILTTSSGTNLKHLTITKGSNTVALDGVGLSLAGNLTLTSGTLDASAVNCSSASCNISLAGNWSNSSTFTPRTGTVSFTGSGQSLTGATTFYNFTKATTTTDTITFPAGVTQTITHDLTLTGAASNLLSLRSSSNGSQWSIDPQGNRTISYLDVKDSNNINASKILATNGTVTNSLNNTNWSFNGPTVSSSSLTPTNVTDGSFIASSTPSLTFTTADTDGNQIRYQLQVDTTPLFTTPVINYVSALGAAATTTFTVGQSAGSGAYLVGSPGQQLSDGTYYWRVAASDTTATSSYATANSGLAAFSVDTTSPSAGALTFGSITTTGLTAIAGSASDTGSGVSTYKFTELTTNASSTRSATNSWTLSSLTSGTGYAFVVNVTDALGNSATSSTYYATTSVPTTSGGTAGSGSGSGGNTPPPLPTTYSCTLNANPSVVHAGSKATLTWTSFENATGTINHSIGTVSAFGSMPVKAPVGKTTYTATFAGSGKKVTCSTVLQVLSNGVGSTTAQNNPSNGNPPPGQTKPKPTKETPTPMSTAPKPTHTPSPPLTPTPSKTTPTPTTSTPPTPPTHTLSGALTKECYRAFNWTTDGNASVGVYRTVTDTTKKLATVNHLASWYIDTEDIGSKDLTYHFTIGPTTLSKTFSATEMLACTITSAASSTTPTTPSSSTGSADLIVVKDIVGNGVVQESINGVYQDTSGQSVAVAVVPEGTLISTTGDPSVPTVLWDTTTNTTYPVAVAGNILSFTTPTGEYNYVLPENAYYRVVFATSTSAAAVLQAVSVPLTRTLKSATPAELPSPLEAAGLMVGITILLLGFARIPFSIVEPQRMFSRLYYHYTYFVTPLYKRSFPWGTVYDSVTKEPIDPAQVRLLDAQGREISTAITDLDGRYGFLVAPGTYRVVVEKTNYQFPSQRLTSTHDLIYDDLYTGGNVVVGPEGTVRLNIPLDPIAEDWNQLAKRRAHLTHFVSYIDRYFAALGIAIFIAGFLFSLWQCITHFSAPSLFLLSIYGAMVGLYSYTGRSRLYGSVVRTDGTPLSFGVLSFRNTLGMEVKTRVLDAQGRYVALFPDKKTTPYQLTVKDRVGEDEYAAVLQKEVLVKGGIYNANLITR